MARKKRTAETEKRIVGDVSDPQGSPAMVRDFLESLMLRDFSAGTIRNRRLHLNDFLTWCLDRGLLRPTDITRPILQRYQRHLFHQQDKRGKNLTFANQHARLVSIIMWFRWLAKNNHLLYNPASELDLPKLGRRLPRQILTPQEADTVINGTNVNDAIGLRDRAILETLYSTGMRRMELIALELYDVDADRGVVIIRQGKGKKDRVVPIGKRAIGWTRRYLADVRPQLVVDPTNTTLYLTRYGTRFSPTSLSLLVKDYVDRAEIGKTGSCHMFRHSMATSMLENGADLRFIQAMLGHEHLNTTQIYTQVAIKKLQQIHEATHPAKAERTKKDDCKEMSSPDSMDDDNAQRNSKDDGDAFPTDS